MKKLYVIPALLMLFSGFIFSQEASEEVVEVSTVEALLALVKEGKTQEQAANSQREAEFMSNKNKQASILAAEKRELARQEKIADTLEDGTVVNILVIGRIGMFYQTKDEQSSGRWNNETGSWDELPGSYRKPIRDGIRMAKKLAPTDMLMMPVVKGEV